MAPNDPNRNLTQQKSVSEMEFSKDKCFLSRGTISPLKIMWKEVPVTEVTMEQMGTVIIMMVIAGVY